jgi:hypothetical protein
MRAGYDQAGLISIRGIMSRLQSGNVYQLHRILVDNPYYDGKTVYPSSKVAFASSSPDFEFSHKDGQVNFCFVTLSRSQNLWLQAMAM